MSDSGTKEVILRLLSESKQEKPAEEFLTEVRTTETPEKEENVLIADSDTENPGVLNMREWEPQKRERKLTERDEFIKRKHSTANATTPLSLETADLKTLDVERDQLDKLKDAFNDFRYRGGKQLAYQ